MNERIKELAKAYLVHERYTRHGEIVEEDLYEFYPDELEEFAQLIVRECAKVCDDLDIDDWGDKSFDDGTYYCSRAIKQHFGVEE